MVYFETKIKIDHKMVTYEHPRAHFACFDNFRGLTAGMGTGKNQRYEKVQKANCQLAEIQNFLEKWPLASGQKKSWPKYARHFWAYLAKYEYF